MISKITSKQKIIRFFLVGLATLVLLIGSVIALAAIYEKEVSAYFLSKLNERLNTRVEIKKVELSLLKHFPYASIRLNQVRAGHARYQADGYLLDVEKIDLLFSVFSLWSGDYAIRKIEIAGGKIQLLRDASGKNNYDILKPAPGGKEDAFGLSLGQVVGRKLDILYKDEQTKVYSRVFVELSELSGQFNAQTYNLDITADIQAELFQTGATPWIRQRPVGLDFTLQVNKPAGTYRFNEGTFRIAELDVGVEGEYRDLETSQYTFTLKGKNLDISTALSLLPPEYEEKVKAYKSQGKFYGEVTISQPEKIGAEPRIKARFGVEEGKVSHEASGVQLSDLNLQGELNGEVLKLDRVNMLLNKQKISGSCVIDGFENPRISLRTDARINLSDLGAFLDIKQFEDLKGSAELHLDVKTNAGAFNAAKSQANLYLAKGSLEIKEGSFRLKDDTLRFQGINGLFSFNQGDMEVTSVSMRAGNSDFSFSGKFQNLLDWLLIKNEVLGIQASVNAGNIFLDEFFQRKTSNAAGNEYRMEISPYIRVELNAKVNQLQFRKFKASAIQGTFRVKDQVLSADNLRFNTMGGSVGMSGGIDASAENSLGFSCSANLKSVDIQKLFFECENFGQETMQDKNLRGKVEAALSFTARGSKSLELDASSVECTADIAINQGELIRFEPMNLLGRYISLDELQHVRFSQLRNQIKISKKTIYFPMMDIESSAISITGSGTHTFDNEIDYHFRVRLSDILSKKAKRMKKENEEFGEVVDDGSGGLNLFLSMKGPMDNLKISYDTKGAREKRKDDIRKEKDILRTIIREEFGKSRKDSSKKSEKPIRKKQPALIMEFDE